MASKNKGTTKAVKSKENLKALTASDTIMSTENEGTKDNFWLIDFDQPITVKISIETEDENGKTDTKKMENATFSNNTHNINRITLGTKSKHGHTHKRKKSTKTKYRTLEEKKHKNKCKKDVESNNLTKLGGFQMVSIVSQVSPEENKLASKADQLKVNISDSEKANFKINIDESNDDKNRITSPDIKQNHTSLIARNYNYNLSNKYSEIEPNTAKSQSLEALDIQNVTVSNPMTDNKIKDQNEVQRQLDINDVNKSQCAQSTQSHFFHSNEGLENGSINKFKYPRIKTTPHRNIQRYRGKMDAMKSHIEKDESNHKSKNKNISIVQTNTGTVNHDITVENEHSIQDDEKAFKIVKPLLEIVAKNIMMLFPALNAYEKERKQLQNESRVNYAWKTFNNLKYYSFSLSHSTICGCLLPHKNNQNFLNMFYDLCEDIAQKENVVHFNRHVLKLLCIEMIDWTFGKQKEIEKFLNKFDQNGVIKKGVKPQTQKPNTDPITPISIPNEYDVPLKRPLSCNSMLQQLLNAPPQLMTSQTNPITPRLRPGEYELSLKQQMPHGQSSQNILTAPPPSSEKVDHVRVSYLDKDGKKVELTINPNRNEIKPMRPIHYYNKINNLRNDTIPDNVDIAYTPPLNTQTKPNIIGQQPFSQTVPTIANELQFQNTQALPNRVPTLQNRHGIADNMLYQKRPFNLLRYSRQRESSEELNRYLPYPTSYSSTVQRPPPPPYVSASSMHAANQENYFQYQKNSNQRDQEPTIWNNAEELNSLIQDRSSISRDSGFMSPTSDNIKSKEPNPQENDVLPTIRFVTSMNPNARFADYKICCVCGSSTNLLCVGCNKVSYCSIDCQTLDWDTHKLRCC